MDNKLELLLQGVAAPLWTDFVISLSLCIFFSFTLKYVYRVSANRIGLVDQNSNILPLLSITVFLVIITVKQSLALSLGLVGALSIVRFRTPVKEPEDLIFYFIAIAIGLGFGAGQILLTTALLPVLFAVIIGQRLRSEKTNNGNFILCIEAKEDLDDAAVITVLANRCETVELKRREAMINRQSVTFEISLNDTATINDLVKELKSQSIDTNITLIESRGHY